MIKQWLKNRIAKAEKELLDGFKKAHEAREKEYIKAMAEIFAETLAEHKKHSEKLRIEYASRILHAFCSVFGVEASHWDIDYNQYIIKADDLIFKEVKQKIESIIREGIDKESFIDALVKRIRDKQL